MKKVERVGALLDKSLPPEPSWIGNAILPKRGTLLLGGLEKIGKSFISLEIARALSTGQNVFGHPLFYTAPTRVLYIEQEIGEVGLQKRVRQVMAAENRSTYEDRFFYISQEPELRLDSGPGLRAIETAIIESQAQVIIFDPLANMHDYDENSNTEIGRLFKAIDTLKAEFECFDLSVVISHHARKPPQDDGRTNYDPLDRKNFRGAHRFLAAPDSIWTIHRARACPTTWEAWECTNRLVLRNDSSPPDFTTSVNRDNDLRVRFERPAGRLQPLTSQVPQINPGP